MTFWPNGPVSGGFPVTDILLSVWLLALRSGRDWKVPDLDAATLDTE